MRFPMKVDFQNPFSYESGFSKSTFIGNLVLTLRFVPQTVPRCSGASVLGLGFETRC